MKPILLLCSLLVATAAFAQDFDTTRHKALYQQINDAAGSMQKVEGSVMGPDGRVALTGWSEGGAVRKIVARPGSTGSGSDEIYLEDGKPVFLFSSYKSDSGAKVEERIYFDEDGRIGRWLSTDKSFVPHAEDAEGMEGWVRENVPSFLDALGGGGGGGEEAAQATEGVFLGIDQGDYAHWKMRADGGDEVSYFVLRTDDAIERVLADPQEYEGRRCRVTWQRRTENLPEAGGETEIDVLTGVTWE